MDYKAATLSFMPFSYPVWTTTKGSEASYKKIYKLYKVQHAAG